MTEKKDQNIRS